MKPYTVTLIKAILFNLIALFFLVVESTNYLIYSLFLSLVLYILTFFIYFEEKINNKDKWSIFFY
jgi:hypothetical protein